MLAIVLTQIEGWRRMRVWMGNSFALGCADLGVPAGHADGEVYGQL